MLGRKGFSLTEYDKPQNLIPENRERLMNLKIK